MMNCRKSSRDRLHGSVLWWSILNLCPVCTDIWKGISFKEVDHIGISSWLFVKQNLLSEDRGDSTYIHKPCRQETLSL